MECFDDLGQNFIVKVLNRLLRVSKQKNEIVELFLEKFEMNRLKALMNLEKKYESDYLRF